MKAHIYGIGTDIIQISRIETAVHRHQNRFVEKILGREEREIYESRGASSKDRGMRFLATRFAAKEAFSKAVGLGMRMPMTWHAVEVLNDHNGKPIVTVSGALAEFMNEHRLSAQISISDEAAYALAFVVVEKI